MGLQEVASWYQRKIGTYDKQLWERTVEQRILHGLTHVPRKTAKLKTELIDLDLVRGSSFPKAKPKHGLVTVARLGIQRLVLLPVYWRWWVQQTSSRVYSLLLLLYVLQILNLGLYYHCIHFHPDETTDNVSASEVLVPTVMMVVLSIVHSQIVSTHSGQPSEFRERSHRRLKRTKRRPLIPSRIRIIPPDSKSSPDTESVKRGSVGDVSGKCSSRVRSKRVVVEDKRACDRTSPVVKETSESTPRIRVCFKEPSGEENGAEPGLEENQRLREGTPMDDDGFESLNGNGSSENGDEPVEDHIEFVLNSIADSKKSSKYSDIYFNCPEQKDSNDAFARADKIDSNSKVVHSESVMCDASLSKAQSLEDELFTKRKLNYEDIVKDSSESKKKSEENVTVLHRSDLNASNEDELEVNEGRLGEKTACSSISKEDGNWPSSKTVKIFRHVHTLQRRQSAPLPRLRCTDHSPDHHETDSEDQHTKTKASIRRDSLLKRRRGSQNLLLTCPKSTADESSYNSSCCDESEDGGDDEALSSPGTSGSCCGNPHLTEGGTTSATEWMGVTTNSEECSYSSDMDESDSRPAPAELNDHPFAWEFEQSPTVILSPSCAASDKVSCTMWESRDVKKADLSVLDISSAIIARVEAMPENMDYFYGGMIMALMLSLVPPLCRFILTTTADAPLNSLPQNSSGSHPLSGLEMSTFASHLTEWTVFIFDGAFGSSLWERTIMIIALLERFALAELFFFLLAVAERTFKQRFLYAKLFSHLTSFRRARKSELPHFRLNKVRNIKTWLSVRSYLRKRGPQRSVDMLVSAAFIITLLLLTFLIVELLKDSVRLNSQYNMEALCWCLALGVFLLRFMTLGTDINRKYCNLSVLITEQINLYLQIEQKPNKKDELMVANSVLKLAADLLKELESPFKISGLSANPYLYNITNVVILSALSGVLSEILGFKLKLHKIKIK